MYNKTQWTHKNADRHPHRSSFTRSLLWLLQICRKDLTRDGPKFGRCRSIRPNVPLGLARQHETIRPKFGRTSANIRRHCGFEL